MVSQRVDTDNHEMVSFTKAWLRPGQEGARRGLGRETAWDYMILKDHYQIWDVEPWFGQQNPASILHSWILSISLYAAMLLESRQ